MANFARDISRVTMAMTVFRVLVTLLVSTHGPPSRSKASKQGQTSASLEVDCDLTSYFHGPESLHSPERFFLTGHKAVALMAARKLVGKICISDPV